MPSAGGEICTRATVAALLSVSFSRPPDSDVVNRSSLPEALRTAISRVSAAPWRANDRPLGSFSEIV